MAVNVSGEGYQIRQLFDDLAQMRSRITRLEGSPRSYGEEAEVTAVGGTQCTVLYDSGTTRIVSYSSTYTPTVGHRVTILNYQSGTGTKGVAIAGVSA